ncbi:hypothetical protein PHJA_000440400 [Phtheirospermum japonicum]|uniref:Uncharacterized protein n=1 Tax=Phtheirospermum japonicum TaxID=374723 RepID=A0A830BFD2_9LAMI|nr:hypothetical protein PHJA_000440400 [Phtheirospermum japonicum]
MWWVVICKSKNSLRRESRMDIEEILKMKLETIKEEPEVVNDENGALTMHRSMSKKVKKKIHLKVKMGKLFMSQLSLKDSYVVFMTGFASRGGLSGLPRY